MLNHGNGLLRVDPKGKDLAFFVEIYSMTPDAFAVEYEITGETVLTPDNIAHIAYIGSDGDIEQLFSLQEGDTMLVHHDERLHDNGFGITNSEHMAFFTLMRGGEMIAKWAADSGPFDCDGESLEVTTRAALLQQIRGMLATAPDQNTFPVTESNTLLFEQL